MVDYNLETGKQGLNSEVVDSLVHQTAMRSYIIKNTAFAIVPSSDWSSTFYREDPAILAGQTGNTGSELPRLAEFPQRSLKFEPVTTIIVKRGLSDVIPYESILSSQIAVQARTIIKLTEGVTKLVDDSCVNALTENLLTDNDGASRVQSMSITLGRQWTESSAAIFNNIQTAARLISVNGNYDTGDLVCFVSPRDKQSIVQYVADKGTQWNSLAGDVLVNGQFGKMSGVRFVESVSVPASYAIVVKPKTIGNWRELVPISVKMKDEDFISTRIRVCEEGVPEIVEPLACCVIVNTQGANWNNFG